MHGTASMMFAARGITAMLFTQMQIRMVVFMPYHLVPVPPVLFGAWDFDQRVPLKLMQNKPPLPEKGEI